MKKGLLVLLLSLQVWTAIALAEESRLPDCDSNVNTDTTNSWSLYESLNTRAHAQRKQCLKEWTMLVYMAADNDLLPFALWDLYEMEAAGADTYKNVGSTPRTDVLTQVDSKPGSKRFHMERSSETYEAKTIADFQNANFSRVTSPYIDVIPPHPSETTKDRFDNFIQWGIREYPAKHYAVILWGHGQGWRGTPRISAKTPINEQKFASVDFWEKFFRKEISTSYGGIGFQQGSNSWMSIPEVKDVLEHTKNTIGHPVDVYVSDACLMQSLEVSYELASSARFISGTSEIQNYIGLPYRRILYELNSGYFYGQTQYSIQDQYDEPVLFANMIPALMRTSLLPKKNPKLPVSADASEFITFSTINSENFTNHLTAQLVKIKDALKAFLSEDNLRAIEVRQALRKANAMEGDVMDLAVFLGTMEKVLNDAEDISTASRILANEIKNTREYLKTTITARAFGSEASIDEKTKVKPYAISLWMPNTPEQFRLRRPEFMVSKFYKDIGWNQWLDLLFRY